MASYNRFDKIDWLMESCGDEFVKTTVLEEMVRWMGEDDFEKFYDRLCSLWVIKRAPNDPNFDAENDADE